MKNKNITILLEDEECDVFRATCACFDCQHDLIVEVDPDYPAFVSLQICVKGRKLSFWQRIRALFTGNFDHIKHDFIFSDKDSILSYVQALTRSIERDRS